MARFTRVFAVPKPRVDFLRGMRFRLMVSFVIFFTILLVVVGLVFHKTLQLETERDVRDALDEEWFEAKGYLKIEKQRPVWVADESDPEDNFIVSRLKHVYLITDANGNALQYDDTYESIGLDSLDEIRRVLALPGPETRVRWSRDGTPYLVKAGKILDEDSRQPYFLAIGRSLAPARKTVSDFTRNYFYMLPAMIAFSGLLGWVLAGRAIQPVNSVAQAAQTITGSNLSLQIPLRGAGDELDRLIESFNKMTARLNQSFEQIRRFSTDVSHELRTPLTAIRGQLEVALFTAETPEQYRDAMVNALEDVEQLSSIVRALLLLSQAESGQLALQKAPLDLGSVAMEVVEQFQIPAQEKNLRLSARTVPGSVVPADRVQIERLLSNLLSNAVKYTPAGGSVCVTIGPSESLAFVSLEVEDSGVGIPAENLPHIFDRFYRVRSPETNKISGLGLGLSFVSWIVEAHGGRIEVTSKVGEGTRFRVLLPRDAEPPAPPQPVEAGATLAH